MWLPRMLRRKAAAVTERRITVRELAAALAGSETKSGIFITSQEALRVSAFFACVRVLANGIATPRIRIMRERDDGRGFEPVHNHPIARLLKRPNPWQTSFEFRQMMEAHLVIYGNAYAFINRVDGEAVELLPLLTPQVSVEQRSDYTLVYRVTNLAGKNFVLPAENLLHLRDMTLDGFRGSDTVKLAREVLALSIGLEESQATLHANGGRPAGILSSELPGVTAQTIEAVRQAWQTAFSGARRNGVAVMDAGFKFTAMAMTAVDAQHLETRRFQIEEVCRYMNVFPQMIMHTVNTTTFASAEAFFVAHDHHTMAPRRRLWEEKIDAALLDGPGGALEARFEWQPMLYMSARDRAMLARTEIELGAITRNEYREATGRPPLPGLDEPLTPLNMDRGKRNDDEKNEDQFA